MLRYALSFVVLLLWFDSSVAFRLSIGSVYRRQEFAIRVAPKPSGINSTPKGKAVVIERTKKMMESSLMILAVPFEGVSKENTDLLKNALPEGAKASMVKNALIRKCVEGTDFVPLAENLKHENMFLFCPEGTSQASYAALRKWQKEVKRTEPEFCAKVVVIEGDKYAGPELEYVVNLPTKKELLARLCRALKDPPTRLARVLNAIPERMAKVFGQVLLQKEEEAKLAALVERIPEAEAAGPPPAEDSVAVPSMHITTDATVPSTTTDAAATAAIPISSAETATTSTSHVVNSVAEATDMSEKNTTTAEAKLHTAPNDTPHTAPVINGTANPFVLAETPVTSPTATAEAASASLESRESATLPGPVHEVESAISVSAPGAAPDTTVSEPVALV